MPIVLGVLAVFGGLGILWAIMKIVAMSGLTTSLVFSLGFAPPPPALVPPPQGVVQCIPASPCPPGYVYVPPPQASAPALVAPTPAPPQMGTTPAIQDVLNALTNMDNRQQARDGKQDERISRIEDRLSAPPSAAPRLAPRQEQPCPVCDPDGRVRQPQRIIARRY